LLKFDGRTNKSDTIHTNIRINGSNWCTRRNMVGQQSW